MNQNKRIWQVEECSRNVHLIRYKGINIGKLDHDMLLMSDHHWDNPHCNRDLLKSHLDEAMKRDAPILINGDLFCLMQGKYDRRSNKDDILPEHAHGNYLDRIVETAIEWWLPYSNNLTVIGQGNHETAILRHHETNITERFVQGIKHANPESPICMGGYGGWIRVKYDLLHGVRGSHKIKYFHGHGGGGPVTKGVIQTNRRSASIDGADLIWTGHVHESWAILIPLYLIK